MTLPVSAPTAIDGYDAVAYFEWNRAVRGAEGFRVEHEGKTWWFASEEHRAAFASAPGRYMPAYGGQCAFATSLGKSEAGNPKRFAMKGGRLFFNSNPVAALLWRILPGRLSAADRHWASRA